MEEYARQPEDVVVLDMEASLEHMTRGTLRHVDALLVVAEPYYRALETVGRLLPLAEGLNIPHVWTVANKVRTPRDEAAINEYCVRRGAEVLATVPYDERVLEADQQGQSLVDRAPDTAAVAAVQTLIARLNERLEHPSSGH